jgi:hypothetical protein
VVLIVKPQFNAIGIDLGLPDGDLQVCGIVLVQRELEEVALAVS